MVHFLTSRAARAQESAENAIEIDIANGTFCVLFAAFSALLNRTARLPQ
jgi:hypothetical protein